MYITSNNSESILFCLKINSQTFTKIIRRHLQNMAFRLQIQHVEVFAEYMEDHSDFAKGRLSVSNSREKFKELWNELGNKLNSLGLGERSVEKWQKTWSDYKGNLKKKAAEVKKYLNETGGGPPIGKTLTDLEKRILDILGTTFYAGVGVMEIGINPSSEVSTEEKPDASTTPESQTVTPTTFNAIKRHRERHIKEMEKTAMNDHDYLYLNKNTETPIKSFKKRKTDSSTEALYKETINSLKNIENTLDLGLKNINDTLKEGFRDLKDIFEKQGK